MEKNNFRKYSDGNREYLCIDSVLIDNEFKTDVYNNTNYENTYYVKKKRKNNGIYEFIKREDIVTDDRYQLFITKENEPIEFDTDKDYKYIELKDNGTSTIEDFLQLENSPYINIGDVNPKEHGAILVDKSSDGTDCFVLKIDKFPEEDAGYLYLEAVIPTDILNEDFRNILDVEIGEYVSNCYKDNDFDAPLFFNEI